MTIFALEGEQIALTWHEDGVRKEMRLPALLLRPVVAASRRMKAAA